MGAFVFIRGDFKCVECGELEDDNLMQTRLLLRDDGRNHAQVYSIGDVECLSEDALRSYYALYPLSDRGRLVVVNDRWCCTECSCDEQWHRVDLAIIRTSSSGHAVRIESTSSFLPRSVAAFDDVNYVNDELATFSGLLQGPDGWWLPHSEGNARWLRCSIAERCGLMMNGIQE